MEVSFISLICELIWSGQGKWMTGWLFYSISICMFMMFREQLCYWPAHIDIDEEPALYICTCISHNIFCHSKIEYISKHKWPILSKLFYIPLTNDSVINIIKNEIFKGGQKISTNFCTVQILWHNYLRTKSTNFPLYQMQEHCLPHCFEQLR